MVVMANDQAIAQACAMGNLELNAFLPLIADALLSSIQLLGRACMIFRTHCVAGIRANEERCRRHVMDTTAVATALVEVIGYEQAQKVVEAARAEGKTIREVAVQCRILSAEQFDELVSPERVTRLGSPTEAQGKQKEVD